MKKYLARTSVLLVMMTSLQLLWLLVTWLTGTAANWQKIPPLIIYTVALGGAMIYMPTGIVSKIDQGREHLVQNEKLLILVLCISILVFGVIYANFQRVWTDEISVLEVATTVAEEGVPQLFDKYIQSMWYGTKHPPLMTIVHGLTMRVFGINLLPPRLVSLILAIATTLITYFLARELYDRDASLPATLLLLSFPLFLRLGTTGISDVPVTFFFTLALFLLFRLLRKPSYRLSIATSIVITLGVLTKYTMVLIYPLLISYFLSSRSFRQLKLHLGIIFLVPICLVSIWLVYAYRIGVLERQVMTLVAFATVVIRTEIGKMFLLETLATRLPSSIGVYNIPLLLLGLMHVWQRRSQSDLFVLLWIVVVSLLLVITLPDHRYFMPTFPALAIMMTNGLETSPEARGRALTLSILFCMGSLYLLVDWDRTHLLFLP